MHWNGRPKYDCPAWWARREWRRLVKRWSNKRLRRLGKALLDDAPVKPYKPKWRVQGS